MTGPTGEDVAHGAEAAVVDGEVIALDFTDRADGRVVILVAVDERSRWGHESVSIVRREQSLAVWRNR